MTVPIARLPERDRPRERLWREGAAALADRELLAILLGSGTAGASALDVAADLLAEAGGVSELARARPEELARGGGVGPARAATVAAAFELGRRAKAPTELVRLRSAADVARVAAPLLEGLRRERVLVLVCDARNQVRHVIPVADGTSDRAPLPVREILNVVLRHDGRAFAVAHNHPAGDPEPGEDDQRTTVALVDAARAVGVRLLSHVVITHGAWCEVRVGPKMPR